MSPDDKAPLPRVSVVSWVVLIGLTCLQPPIWLFGLLHMLVAGAPSDPCAAEQVAREQCGPSTLQLLAFGSGALVVSLSCTATAWISLFARIHMLVRVVVLLVPLAVTPLLYVVLT